MSNKYSEQTKDAQLKAKCLDSVMKQLRESLETKRWRFAFTMAGVIRSGDMVAVYTSMHNDIEITVVEPSSEGHIILWSDSVMRICGRQTGDNSKLQYTDARRSSWIKLLDKKEKK